MHSIDLRSDTVTQPTAAMKEAMFNAPVGDDVFAEDPSLNALEERVAAMFGHEAAIFCPSGTMTNQIAIKVHTRPGDEVICHHDAHIFRYEGGGIAANAGAQAFLLDGPHGTFSVADAAAAVHAPDSHYPRTALVAIENTTNRGGGALWNWEVVRELSQWCQKQNLPLHIDGARLFNALVATQKAPEAIGPLFQSISICFSKGLGCPVGSALIGSKDFIKEAHRVRKRMGGGMRQAGYLAAACNYALDHHVDRLAEDHKNATLLAEALQNAHDVVHVMPVATNIVIFNTSSTAANSAWLEYLDKNGLRCLPFGPTSIRFVTHLDVSEEEIRKVCDIITAR